MGPQPAQASPRCTKCNSPPINGQCTNHHTAVYCMMFHCSVSTGPCQATPRITWPTTVRSSPTPVSDNCVLPTLEHSLSVSQTRSSFEGRSFAAAGPQVCIVFVSYWNSLPPNLRLCGLSYSQFSGY